MKYVIGQIVASEPCDRAPRVLNLAGGVLPQHRELTWYLARAVSRQEKRAEASLSNVGVAYYFPRLTFWERQGRLRLKTKVRRSLFEGYGFIGLARDQSAHGLPKLEGFIGPVWTGKDCRPRGVSLDMIEKIVRQELTGKFDLTGTEEVAETFTQGELVRVIDGSFAGFNASITRAPAKHRVEVLVSLFGRLSRVELDLCAIEKMA